VIRWLLNLFPAYQRLIAENAEQKAEIASLTAEAAASEARAEATDRRVEDLQRVVDSYARQATGRMVFTKAEAPVAATVEMPARRAMLASQYARQRTLEAQQQQAAYYRQQFEQESAASTDSQTA
jgi:hypothetical protein